MTRKRSSPPDSPRCLFTFADGRRCRLPAVTGQALPAISKAGLPDATSSDGLCYHHFHAPRRRMRRSELIRELESISSHPIDNSNIRRLLAKIPAAIADGILTPTDAGIIRQNCALMLQCERLSRREPLPEPRGSEWNFVVSLLNSDADDEIPDAQLSSSPALR